MGASITCPTMQHLPSQPPCLLSALLSLFCHGPETLLQEVTQRASLLLKSTSRFPVTFTARATTLLGLCPRPELALLTCLPPTLCSSHDAFLHLGARPLHVTDSHPSDLPFLDHFLQRACPWPHLRRSLSQTPFFLIMIYSIIVCLSTCLFPTYRRLPTRSEAP